MLKYDFNHNKKNKLLREGRLTMLAAFFFDIDKISMQLRRTTMKKFISLPICILVSFVYGHIVFLNLLTVDHGYFTLNDYPNGLLFSIMFLLPFIMIIGIPTYITINAVMKYISKHKYIFEIMLYMICGMIGAGALILLFSFQDLSKVEALWKPFFVLSLSCAIPFGATSILLKNINRVKTSN